MAASVMAGSGKTFPHSPNGWLAVIEHGPALVAGADQLEQHAGLGLVLGDVGEVVEDQQVEAVEPVDGGFEVEFAARDLELLDEVGGAGEQDACQPFSIEGEADGCSEMALSAAGRPEQQQIGAFVEPGVAGGDGHDLGLGDHRHGIEVEGVEGLAGRQAGFGEMPLDAAAITLGQFMLGDSSQEAGGGPAFLVGLLGELRPERLDGRQAQFVEHDGEPCGIGYVVRWPSCRVSRQAVAEQVLVGIERSELRR